MMRPGHSRAAAPLTALLASSALSLIALPALAQDRSEGEELEEVVVTGSRLPASIESFPQSVTIIGEEEIEQQRSLSRDLGDLLGVIAPALAPSSSTSGNRDQTLRGRKPSVFIDGILVSTPMLAGDQEVRSIDASFLERIEVINGSTALYGSGGNGGVINYITKRPRTDKGLSFVTEVGASASLTHFEDSVAPSIRQTVMGGRGPVSFILSGHAEKYQSFFDADGDRIPPQAAGGASVGLPDSDIFSGFGKFSFDLPGSRLDILAVYYEQEQDSPYRIVNGSVRNGIKTTTANLGRDPREILVPSNRNKLFAATYGIEEVLGSRVTLQAYRQEFRTVFAMSPTFPSAARPSQSVAESKKWGLRSDIETKLGFLPGVTLLWGLDYSRDLSEQGLADGRTWSPEMDLATFAQYAQLSWEIADRLVLRGGVRHEANEVDVPTYTTFRGVTAQGGTLEFDATTFNMGAAFDLTDQLIIFTGYSQGSSVGEIGRVLRDIRTNTSVETVNPRAVIVDTYEAGLRGNFDRFRFELTAFLNTSKYGLQLVEDPANPLLTIALQEDERIHGIEASGSYRVSDRLNLSGSFVWTEGKRDADHDGDVETKLDNVRIAPVKATLAADYTLPRDWRARLQALYSHGRDPFPGQTGREVLNLGKNSAYYLIDAMVAGPVGPGELSVGVQNLTNQDYFTRFSGAQNRSDRFVKGPGATLRMSYTVEY